MAQDQQLSPAPSVDTGKVPVETGDPLIASASVDGELKIWRLAVGATGFKSISAHQGAAWALTDLGDGRVASGGKDQVLRIWDLVYDGELSQEIDEKTASPVSSLHPLWGGRLAVGHASGAIFVYNIGDGETSGDMRFGKVAQVVTEATGQLVSDGGLLMTLSGHKATVNALCAVEVPAAGDAPKRRLLVSGSDDKTVCVWDATSGALQATLQAEAFVYALSHLGGSHVCVGLQSGAIQVWDVAAGTLLASELKAHGGLWVKALCPSSDGRGVVSGGGDCCVRVWKWSPEAKALTPAGEPLKGHEQAVTALYADPAGWLLSGGGQSLRVWGANGIADGTVIRQHGAMITSVTPVVQREWSNIVRPRSKVDLTSGVGNNGVAVATPPPPVPAARATAPPADAPGSLGVYRKRKDGGRIPPFAFT